jgi:hypothetical protein
MVPTAARRKGCVAEPRQLPGAATSPRVGEAWWFRHAQGLSEKTPIATRVSRALRRYSQQAALFLDLNCRYSYSEQSRLIRGRHLEAF